MRVARWILGQRDSVAAMDALGRAQAGEGVEDDRLGLEESVGVGGDAAGDRAGFEISRDPQPTGAAAVHAGETGVVLSGFGHREPCYAGRSNLEERICPMAGIVPR